MASFRPFTLKLSAQAVFPRIAIPMPDRAAQSARLRSPDWEPHKGLDEGTGSPRPVGERNAPPGATKPVKIERNGDRVTLHYRDWTTKTVHATNYDLYTANVLNSSDYLDAPLAQDLPARPESPPAKYRRRSTLLDTVQKIRPSQLWQRERDALDQRIRDNIYNELRKRGMYEKSARMDLCGIPRSRLVCTKCGEVGDTQKIQCNIYQICPTCQRIRSAKLKKEIKNAIPHIKPVANHRWLFLTLPVETGSDYAGATRLLIASYSKLWRGVLQKEWKFIAAGTGPAPKARKGREGLFVGRGTWVVEAEHKGVKGYWRPVGKSEYCAAFRALEFGGLNGNAHLHSLLYSPWIPQAVISAKWAELTGSYVVDIRAVAGANLKKAIDEVAKYICKVQGQPASKLVDFYLAMKGKHTTQRYGQFRGLVRTEKQLFEEPCKCGCLVFDVEILPYAIGLQESISMRGPPVQATIF